MKENGSPAQKTVSGLIGHGENSLSRLITKKNTPSLLIINDFCDHFGITLSDFFKEDYSCDKSIGTLMKLLSEKYDADDISNLYELLNRVDKASIKSLLKTYSEFYESKSKEK